MLIYLTVSKRAFVNIEKKNNIFEICYDNLRNNMKYDFFRGTLPENGKVVKTISLYI
jgi:hypothetical protein